MEFIKLLQSETEAKQLFVYKFVLIPLKLNMNENVLQKTFEKTGILLKLRNFNRFTALCVDEAPA